MKRFLAILTVALMAGCCVAFADSADTANTGNTDTMNSGQTQEPGTMNESTTTIHKSAKRAKTCTDDNGNTFKHGEPGFKTCWNAQHPKQESGTAAKNDNNKMNNEHMNDTNNANNPSAQSGSQNQNY